MHGYKVSGIYVWSLCLTRTFEIVAYHIISYTIAFTCYERDEIEGNYKAL